MYSFFIVSCHVKNARLKDATDFSSKSRDEVAKTMCGKSITKASSGQQFAPIQNVKNAFAF